MSEVAEPAVSQGTLFSSPDVDEARNYYASKSRAMTSKLMSVSEAVGRFVRDGDYIVTGGFGCTRVPEAVLLELIRQRRRHLGLCAHSATHNFQVLAAGHCFDKCDIGYIVGLELLGLSPNARRYMESGEVQMTEWTNACLAWRLKAGAMGIPFIPARTALGTDVFKYSAAKEIDCPFTGKRLLALPALIPDVGIIHVHQADIYGNTQIEGIAVLDYEISRASKRIIVTTERLVDTDEIRKNPSHTHIPYWLVDSVCHVPYGAYPSEMPYEYFNDEAHLTEWVEAEKDHATLEAFLNKYVHGTQDFAEYLSLKGGERRLAELRALEPLRRE
jgi:glutaconate CoA-transferase, subunit A